ncbi:MAG: VOC family protein [Actinobacteria bacterium]|nr:VOC family protein [Actinomycetota bacterium]
MPGIDHVLVAARDPDATCRLLEAEHGLASVVGGRHAGFGTANRIVPLGSAYLEVVGVVDETEAAGSLFGRFVGARLGEGDGFLGWCVALDDLDPVASRLGLGSNPGTRTRPDGSTLSWRVAGWEVTMDDPALPFFIEWSSPPERHPGRDAAPHRRPPSGIAWVEVGGGEAVGERLTRWLGGARLPVRTVPGPSRPLAVGVAMAEGDDAVVRL